MSHGQSKWWNKNLTFNLTPETKLLITTQCLQHYNSKKILSQVWFPMNYVDAIVLLKLHLYVCFGLIAISEL